MGCKDEDPGGPRYNISDLYGSNYPTAMDYKVRFVSNNP